MRIQFCGANRTVTGSCHLIEVNGLRLILDMGLYQGPREEARRLNLYLPENVQKADAIILSHGHLDHCGKLPVAVKDGYAGPIYCTAGTAEVARVVLSDSAQIQEEDAVYLNRRTRGEGEKPVEPLYTPADIPPTLRQFKRIKYEQVVDLGHDVQFSLHEAGHILGSAYVVLKWKENNQQKSLLFTADIGRYGSPILRDPELLRQNFDHIITESTYGSRIHGPMSGVEDQLLEAVKYCIEHRSRLIVPSFAVGRTQTILWYLQKFVQEKRMPVIPIFVDSPMGVEVSRIHSTFSEYYDDQTRQMLGEKDLFGLARITFAASTRESKLINGVPGACVIIASSPTCEFGRVLHHIKVSIEREHDMILFVGWVPPQTLGRRLQDSQDRVRIYDRWYDVKCQVRTAHGLSAHADGGELVRFLTPGLNDKTCVHVVHGEPHDAEALAAAIAEKGVASVNVPAIDSSVLDL